MSRIWDWLLDRFARRDWHPVERDGAFIMRRRINGGWEYRDMTDEERHEDDWWRAIR